MQKLLIIDDEPIIREGLKSIIPWADYGYEVCGVGIDGNDGLNKIRLYNPDLVLLDIRMPGISGIDLVKQIREENYTSKFIVLTAYSSFSYAKELMGHGIEAYLLKPIDEDELIEILEKISKEREEERNLQHRLTDYNQMNEDKTLRALLDGDWESIADDLMEEFRGKQFQVARFSSEISEKSDQWLKDKIKKYADQIKRIRKDNHVHLLFINLGATETEEFLSEVQNRLHLYGDESIVLMLGSLVNGPEEIITSYAQAKGLIDVYFCFSEKSILVYKDLEVIDQEKARKLEKINKQKLYHYLAFGDQKNLKRKLATVEKHYKSVRYSKERIKAEIIEWCISVFKIIHQNYPDLDIISRDTLAMHINKQENLQDIVQYIYETFMSISELFNGHYTTKGNVVDNVKDYIDHYYHEEISLKLVADLFHYNSAYLGKAFRGQTGVLFNTYLHQVRIKHAKKLLMNKQYKVYEIAELVGYSNSDYFYKNFKQYEGISPKEYQMQYSQADTSE